MPMKACCVEVGSLPFLLFLLALFIEPACPYEATIAVHM